MTKVRPFDPILKSLQGANASLEDLFKHREVALQTANTAKGVEEALTVSAESIAKALGGLKSATKESLGIESDPELSHLVDKLEAIL